MSVHLSLIHIQMCIRDSISSGVTSPFTDSYLRATCEIPRIRVLYKRVFHPMTSAVLSSLNSPHIPTFFNLPNLVQNVGSFRKNVTSDISALLSRFHDSAQLFCLSKICFTFSHFNLCPSLFCFLLLCGLIKQIVCDVLNLI